MVVNNMAIYMIYTDGSADLRYGIGAWAYIIYERKEGKWVSIKSDSKGKEDTTNNEMELLAVVKALEGLQKHGGINSSSVLVCSDSRWVVKCLTDPGWKCTAHGTLFRRVKWFMKNFSVRLKWVKAHRKDIRNNAVDKLAKKTMIHLRDKLYGSVYGENKND
jgi:ribonuclease HI